jgi:uncharacterized protein
VNTIPNIFSEEISDDFFVLSSQDISVGYAPLRGKVFQIKEKRGVEVLKQYFLQEVPAGEVGKFLEENNLLGDIVEIPSRIGKPYEPKNLVLSLTSDCNLRCTYCYASGGESSKTMSWAVAEKAIRIAIEERKRLGFKSFKLLFHGGGEALVKWNLLQRATRLVDELWEGEKNFSVVTNTTLIDAKKAKWLKDYNFNVSVSLDGPKDIHDLHRPKSCGEGSFEDCIRGALYLKQFGVTFGIRATICASSINRLTELILIAKALDCGVQIEPISITGRAEDEMEAIPAEKIYEAILNGEKFAKALEVKFLSTYVHDLKSKSEFCGGNGEIFCVLPDGKVSSCTRVTKKDDHLSDVFFVGEFNSNLDLKIDPEKVSNLRNLSVKNYVQCECCFAKWYCVGGCHHTRLLNDGLMPTPYCELTRALLFDQLRKKSMQVERR